MGCTHPILAVAKGLTKNGKTNYKILGPARSKKFNDAERLTYENFPCGKCLSCLIQRQSIWGVRCMLEAKQWTYNQFITLTYDNKNLPWKQNVDDLTGEITYSRTLLPSDLSAFIKRLRRHYHYHYGIKKIRFFACGEYGDLRGRPHYHLIAFNLPVFDQRFEMKNDYGDGLFMSDTITKIWGKGRVVIGAVTADSAAYVARYNFKKIGAGKSNKRIAEFIRMSRNPGIAYDYYVKNKDTIYSQDKINYMQQDTLKSINVPRFFDKKLELDDNELYNDIKERRIIDAEKALQEKMDSLNLTPVELWDFQNELVLAKKKNILKKL